MHLNIQRSLHAAAYKRARSLMGSMSEELSTYEKSFHQSLPETFENSSSQEVLSQIETGTIVFYGDFHSLASSQKGFYQLLASLFHRKTTDLIVALECFPSQAQGLVDSYMAGEINEMELFEKTSFQESWGFPWVHYKAILQFAKKYRLQVLAVNAPHFTSHSLRKRDDHMAEKLLDVHKRHPQHVILCLVGEQHLADQHLPSVLRSHCATDPSLESVPAILRLLHGVDKYYFKILENPLQSSASCLKLQPDLFCFISEPPWYKWLSHSLWMDCLEYSIENESTLNSPQIYKAIAADIDDYFLDLLNLLNEYLEASVPEELITNFHIHISHPSYLVPLSVPMGQRSFYSPFIQQSREYYFDANTNTVTWTAFAWDSFVKAAAEFIFHNVHSSTYEKLNSAQKLYYEMTQNMVGHLVLYFLNPSLGGSPVFTDREQVGLEQLRHVLHENNITTTDLFLKYIRNLQNYPSLLLGSQRPHLSPPLKGICHLLARYLYTHWREEQAFHDNLKGIFKANPSVHEDFMNSALKRLWQELHPRKVVRGEVA